MTRDRDLYHYDECGLDYVWLDGVICEDGYVSIPDMDGLHTQIGLYIMRNRGLMSGDEFRFIRIELGMSIADFADYSGMSYDSVRGWEKDRGVNPAADRLLRVLYMRKLQDPEVDSLLKEIARLNREIHAHSKHIFRSTGEGWRMAA